jgi:serine/threonine protein kinase
MDAGSLDGILKIYKAKKVTPNIDKVILAKIAIQILCGLSYLHTNNQFHRDIKPANILLNSKG